MIRFPKNSFESDGREKTLSGHQNGSGQKSVANLEIELRIELGGSGSQARSQRPCVG